jgi:hypothetical protein
VSTGREAPVLIPSVAPAPGRAALFLGGLMVLGVAVLHVAMIFVGAPAYRYFGAGGRMAQMAAAGSPVPALITLAAVVVFVAVGLYGLSGAGRLRRLPLLRTGLVAIGTVFTLPGIALVAELSVFVHAAHAPPVRFLVFSAVSLAIGLFYLVGTVVTWQALGKGGGRAAGSAGVRPSGAAGQVEIPGSPEGTRMPAGGDRP